MSIRDILLIRIVPNQEIQISSQRSFVVFRNSIHVNGSSFMRFKPHSRVIISPLKSQKFFSVVLEKLIQKKVKSGAYNNASEVVREALRLLEEQDKMKEMKLQQLKTELQKGLNQLNDNQYSTKTLQTIAKSIKGK